jgi:hypothetical protein
MSHRAWAGPGKEGVSMVDLGELIPLPEVAARYGLAARTVYDRAWRKRVGLPVVKLGGKIVGVRAQDLAAVLRREFEPAKPGASRSAVSHRLT